VLLPLSVLVSWQRLSGPEALPASARELLRAVAPFEAVNAYGLFAQMTKERPEILVEGSQDGKEWRAYELRYKPDRLEEAPGLVGLHMPRVDWQLWFAALSSCRRSPWFLRFSQRLLEGRPEVLRLLGENPFPDGPPKYVRSTLFRYRFTTSEEKAASGAYWAREVLGPYCPALMLRDGELTAAGRGM
jgi:lipase maturation factor 1